MSERSELADYYARRAPEYERIYDKPERQGDLVTLGRCIREAVTGRRVLEVACGTGYWTERFAASAAAVVATDVNDVVLQIARGKEYAPGRVLFALADAFDLGASPEVAGAAPFSAAVVAFWLSHIPRASVPAFLSSLGGVLARGAVVGCCDNRLVPDSNRPITRTSESGDTYQTRTLDDHSVHEVLKNFLVAEELLAAVPEGARDAEVIELQYYWLLTYRVG